MCRLENEKQNWDYQREDLHIADLSLIYFSFLWVPNCAIVGMAVQSKVMQVTLKKAACILSDLQSCYQSYPWWGFQMLTAPFGSV